MGVGYLRVTSHESRVKRHETPGGRRRLHGTRLPRRPMNTPLHRLVLPFGLVLAAAVFVHWTVVGYQRDHVWTPDGLLRATFVLGVVLLLAAVLRFAQWFTERTRP